MCVCVGVYVYVLGGGRGERTALYETDNTCCRAVEYTSQEAQTSFKRFADALAGSSCFSVFQAGECECEHECEYQTEPKVPDCGPSGTVCIFGKAISAHSQIHGTSGI